MEVEILGHYYHITAWTSCGSEMWCISINIYMNNGALIAVKKLYIRLCAARDMPGYSTDFRARNSRLLAHFRAIAWSKVYY
jgi:hypothetical protein